VDSEEILNELLKSGSPFIFVARFPEQEEITFTPYTEEKITLDNLIDFCDNLAKGSFKTFIKQEGMKNGKTTT